jgi:hypothetical protein
MPNTKSIFELLKKDHREVERLISQLEKMDEDESDERDELFTELKQKITAHSKAEEQAFYDTLEEDEESEDLVEEAKCEHEEVEEILEEMEGMGSDDDEWETKLADLKQDLQHHIREEEGEIFEKAKEALSQEDLQEIGEEFLELKAQYGSDEDEEMEVEEEEEEEDDQPSVGTSRSAGGRSAGGRSSNRNQGQRRSAS